MVKVRLLNNPHQEYCKYRYQARQDFFKFVEGNNLKEKSYKNGNNDFWFNKSQFKCARYLINAMERESIALEVTGLK